MLGRALIEEREWKRHGKRCRRARRHRSHVRQL